MGVHHMAFATKDTEANHRFYTEAMGFELVKVEMAAMGKGWAKHLFYSTGPKRDQMIAFWELHDPALGDDWSADISRGQGLPPGINHLAFSAEDIDDLAVHRDRWLAAGQDVLEIDHDWCISIYTEDPNGILVEFCTLTRDFSDEDRAVAQQRLAATALEPGQASEPKGRRIFKAADYSA